MTRVKAYVLGDRFRVRLPRYIGMIPDMSDLFQAEDKEFSRMDDLVRNFSLSLVVSTLSEIEEADDYLRLLEVDYGLPHSGTKTERIASILAKMQGRRTTTVEVILGICEAFGHRAEFVPLYEAYAFKLVLLGSRHFGRKFIEALREAMPAHLVVEFEQLLGDRLRLLDGSKVYMNPFYITGSNRHKVGTVYRHQFVGQAMTERIRMPDQTRTPQQRVPKTNEPQTGQVYRYQKG